MKRLAGFVTVVGALLVAFAVSAPGASATDVVSITVAVDTNVDGYVAKRMDGTPFLDNGTHHFRLQTDGNAVVYSGSQNTWSTRTSGNPGSTFYIQRDGNLVVRNAAGQALWSSGTAIRRPSTCYTLNMQSDGNLVFYRNTWTGSECLGAYTVVWRSGTAGT